ncbi:hypothetical protein IHE45_16G046700 [Dioscorea alata]|uniref:Uncharacterized protein n=1 Tax=Dioscorea alata TaxID=55571 RepID=A0ACB7UHK6_DIOAL|nr:hypothetical protein IHE45_16G046700 [Dioscorea alata]
MASYSPSHSPTMTEISKPSKPHVLYRYTPSSTIFRPICVTLALLLLLFGLTSLILYLVYRPSHPHFTILGAAVYSLSTHPNSTFTPSFQPNTISTNLQFTILSRNPSHRATISYDRLNIYVSYRNQPITPPLPLQPMFQDTDSSVSFSPVLGADNVPVSPEVIMGLASDQEFGVVSLRVVLLGRIKYRTGPFRSGWTSLYVRCDIMLGITKRTSGQVPMLGAPNCDVDV